MSAISKIERAIARILLIRYEQDIARSFSTRLYSIALIHLPTLMMRCAMVAGPGWVANNADSNEVKDFFRAVFSMDMRRESCYKEHVMVIHRTETLCMLIFNPFSLRLRAHH